MHVILAGYIICASRIRSLPGTGAFSAVGFNYGGSGEAAGAGGGDGDESSSSSDSGSDSSSDSEPDDGMDADTRQEAEDDRIDDIAGEAGRRWGGLRGSAASICVKQAVPGSGV
jgi:hypothetical protein